MSIGLSLGLHLGARGAVAAAGGPEVVGEVHGQSSNFISVTVDYLPLSPVNGDIVLAMATSRDALAVLGTATAGWSAIEGPTTVTGLRGRWFAHTYDGSGSSVTISDSSGNEAQQVVATVVVVRGASGIGDSAPNAVTDSVHVTAAVTPAAVNSLLLGFWAQVSASAGWSEPEGSTEVVDWAAVSNNHLAASIVEAGTNPVTLTAISGSANSVNCLIALTPA